jgi:hypothetical protein
MTGCQLKLDKLARISGFRLITGGAYLIWTSGWSSPRQAAKPKMEALRSFGELFADPPSSDWPVKCSGQSPLVNVWQCQPMMRRLASGTPMSNRIRPVLFLVSTKSGCTVVPAFLLP